MLATAKKVGGNRKPQTFRNCLYCKSLFGPLDSLKRKCCSKKCGYELMKLQPSKVKRVAVTKARSANSLLAYHVKAGNIVRPDTCEDCNITGKRIEGAHFNYDEPLKVRWLCRSCHVKWDKKEPKGGTVILERWEKFTGKTASLVSGS